MAQEQITLLLKAIFSDNRMFEVTQVNVEHKLFTLTDFQGKCRFYQYELDIQNDIIAIYNPLGELKYHRYISDYLKVA